MVDDFQGPGDGPRGIADGQPDPNISGVDGQNTSQRQDPSQAVRTSIRIGSQGSRGSQDG